MVSQIVPETARFAAFQLPLLAGCAGPLVAGGVPAKRAGGCRTVNYHSHRTSWVLQVVAFQGCLAFDMYTLQDKPPPGYLAMGR